MHAFNQFIIVLNNGFAGIRSSSRAKIYKRAKIVAIPASIKCFRTSEYTPGRGSMKEEAENAGCLDFCFFCRLENSILREILFFMSKNLKNQVVWITGASSGIGASLAAEFARRGARLALSARRRDKLEEVKEKLHGDKKTVLVVPLDVSEKNDIADAVQEVIKYFGHVDILINNSGISQRSTVHETSNTVVRRIMEVNFFGAVLLTKALLPYMLQRGKGHVACTSSIVGKFGFPLRSAYSASKHALHGFFDSLRAEYPQIDVTIIIPGRIQTEISLNALTGEGEPHGKLDPGQQGGLDAGKAARKIVNGLARSEKEILVGGKELIMVHIRRFLPRLYYYMANRVRPA